MTPFGKGVSRILSALLSIGLIFVVIAAAGVIAAMAFLSSVPEGALALLPLGSSTDFAASAFGSPGGRVAFLVVMLERLIVAVTVVVMLRRMLGSALLGTPFVSANVSRLRIIAGAYAISVVMRFVLPAVAPAAITAWLVAHGWAYDIGDLGPSMVALVIAEVFREGIRLREEADMTV